MKTSRVPLALLLLISGFSLHAQVPVSVTVSPPPAVGPLRSTQEIEQLVAPIALYPDALIALILPAATAPADIVLAARHLRDFPGDRSQIEHRAWDDSVKSLTHYAEVLRWMDENLQWTKQIGEAFAEQPADVMQAVQRLRAKASAAGTLVDTPQQRILAEPQVIRIVPAQPDIIYVPHYEPEIVFVDRPVYYSRPFMTFGVGVAVGSWLAFDCDWRRHSIWAGNRHRHWSGHDWHRPVVPLAVVHHHHTRAPEVRQWRPPAHHARTSVAASWHSRPEVVRPSQFGSTGQRAYAPRSSVTDGRRETHSLPAASPLPRTFVPGQRGELPGPRAPHSAAAAAPAPTPVPAFPMARNNSPAAIANAPSLTHSQAPTNANSTRPGGGAGNGGSRDRDRETRVRSYQPSAANHTPLPTVPSLPMAGPAHSGPRMGPSAPVHQQPQQQQQRTYSRSAPASPHAAVPSLPMAAPARNAVVGPTAPQAAAPAAAPAQTVPAPARSGDDRRGGRRNENTHEH